MTDRYKTQKTYIDSSRDQGSIDPFKIGPNSLDKTIFRPGQFGERTVPGNEGFMYADQPEATVYIRKKQWRGEEWTYTVSDGLEKDGKSQEIKARQYLARIITRKLDWIANHEKFTKTIGAIQSLNEFLPSLYVSESGITAEQVTTVLDQLGKVKDLVTEEYAPVTFSGTGHTRYYVEAGNQNRSVPVGEFNGIMELANISSISVNVSNNGEGTASIVIENPQNIFYISEEDIDISLGEDPFLEEGDNIKTNAGGKLYYFRGRYYTKRAYDLLKGVGAARDVQNVYTELDKTKLELESLQRHESNLKFDVVSQFSNDIITVAEYKLELEETQRKIEEWQAKVDKLEEKRTEILIEESKDATDEEKEQIKRVMQKHFQGKCIFEVMDHVYIWTTSPTLTVHNLNRDSYEPIAEVADGKYIQRRKELDNSIEETQQELESYKTNLQNDYKYNMDEDARRTYDNAVEDLEQEIEKLQRERMQLTIDESTEEWKSKFETNRYLGLSETQYQIFEGVVQTVTDSYNDGIYRITLQCRDVMYFLEISRIMTKPGLLGTSSQAPQAFLENPIWREDDPNIKEHQDLVGKWKSGLYTVNHHGILDSLKDKEDQKALVKGLSPTDVTGKAKKYSEVRNDNAPTAVTESFAKVDAANIVSLLVTGVPYNMRNFLENATEYGRIFIGDEDTGSTELTGFFVSLRRQISGQNDRLGDFEPFLHFQVDIDVLNETIENETNTLEKTKKDFRSEMSANGKSTYAEEYLKIASSGAKSLNYLVKNNRKVTNSQLSKGEQELLEKVRIAAVNLKSSEYEKLVVEKFQQAKEDKEQDDDRAGSIEADRELIVSNKDKNYLVVDESYSVNSNIQAFNVMIANSNDFNLWQSDYDSPRSVCQRAAEQVDFEFYADTQGNLRFKPPTYNRVLKEHLIDLDLLDPFYKDMLLETYGGLDGQEYGDAVAKTTLIERELDRQRDLRVNAERREVALRRELKNANLSESEFNSILKKAVSSVKEIFIKGESAFKEVSKSANRFSSKGTVASNKTPEELEDYLDQFNSEINAVILKIGEDLDSSNIEEYKRTKIKQLTYEIRLRSEFVEYLLDFQKSVREDEESSRESAEKEFIKLVSLVDEDRIHRISDAELISSSFSENKPDFTRLDILGSAQLTDLTVAMGTWYWSGGVDYDLWRSYGYTFQSKKKAFLHDGEACEPYCAALLGRQWGKVFSGSIVIRGDSKYKLGDCVFMEDRNMYYYISGIAHSYTYGQTYQTTLTLIYGRRPGFYIPHPFDLLGTVAILAVKRLITGNLYRTGTTMTSTGKVPNTTESEQSSQSEIQSASERAMEVRAERIKQLYGLSGSVANE